MKNVWIVRSKPHGINRLKDFLDKNVVAIGWPYMGELSNVNSKDDVWRKLDQAGYNNNRSNRAIGQDVGVIYRFVKEIWKQMTMELY